MQMALPTVCFYLLSLLLLTRQALCRVTPVFACDTKQNPSLSSFRFCNLSLSVNDRVDDLLNRLTVEEKIQFLSAGTVPSVERLGIPHYEWWSEALHGLTEQGHVTKFSKLIPASTNFPQVILTAASFNLSLFEAIGKAISTEARAMYNVGQTGLTFWAPNVNIFRDPRWGRGQETPGEDPLLSSKYACAYVRGLQKRDDGDLEKLKVAASCKHYTAYDLDSWHGINRFHFNAQVTKQDMEDTFQPPFKSCVLDGKVASIMCSYNEVNGKPTCGDPDLLSGVIRGEWKLDGYIVSDCDSVEVMFKSQHYTKTKEEAAAISILAGLDLDCGFFTSHHTKGAIEKGLVNESDINKAMFNNFRTLMRLGFFDGHPKNHLYGSLGPSHVCSPEHEELALDAARQGIVLLKNTPTSLPLSAARIKKLAVIGPNANVTKEMIGSYYGVPCKNTTFLQGLTKFVPTSYVESCYGVACRAAEFDEAKRIAAAADATVLIMGVNVSIETEGTDRIKIRLPGKQQNVITEVAKVSKGPTILVIMSGCGVDISFAKANNKITSILWVGYPGEAGGAAIADVIFGQYNPSGRLPMTWYPQSFAEQVPMNDMNMRPNASRGYPGRTYRFYTGETVYSFGDGLSYSEIKYKLVRAPESVLVHVEESHLGQSSSECKSVYATDQTCAQNSAFDMQLEVLNLGKMRVSHTILLFSTPPSVHNSPQKQLVDFKKVALKEKESKSLVFKVDICKHLSIVDEVGRWRIALGEHVFQIGDLKHSITVRV